MHKVSTSIDKKDFLHLLAATLTEMDKKAEEGAIKKDLISSFKATGLVPLDPTRVLQKIPSEDDEPEANVNNVLVDYLMQQRYSATPNKKKYKETKTRSGTRQECICLS